MINFKNDILLKQAYKHYLIVISLLKWLLGELMISDLSIKQDITQQNNNIIQTQEADIYPNAQI